MIWDLKREGDALFQHLQGSYGRVLTPREAAEVPRQRTRSPLSPTEIMESATVRLVLILSALLCSVNNADLKTATWLLYCLRLRSRSPHNAQHSTSYSCAHVSHMPSIPLVITVQLLYGLVRLPTFEGMRNVGRCACYYNINQKYVMNAIPLT